jgi:protoporphyrinogen IX oxidase
MLWFLVVHIGAVLFWCGGLLYVPALIANTSAGRVELGLTPRLHASMARFVFTNVATPAALLAIAAGTGVFLLNQTTAVWFVAKLTLVVGLVVVHSLVGLLVMRAEDEDGKPVLPWCWVHTIAMCALMIAIIWLVLAKPALELTAWLS